MHAFLITFLIVVMAVAGSYLLYLDLNPDPLPKMLADKYHQPLDQQGNFTAFGEKWFCYKTGVQMECKLQ